MNTRETPPLAQTVTWVSSKQARYKERSFGCRKLANDFMARQLLNRRFAVHNIDKYVDVNLID